MPLALGIRSTIASTTLLFASCAGAPSPLYPVGVPAGSRRLVQVVRKASRAEILGAADITILPGYQTTRDLLLISGIEENEIRDGTFAFGRAYCCGGPMERTHLNAFIVPDTLQIEVDDIIEIESGRLPNKETNGLANTAIRVRQTADGTDQKCRWDPPDPKLWTRILYCDWMPAEGWLKKGTWMGDAWIKP